jgi:hypothetical protein
MTFETRQFGQPPISTDIDFDWRWPKDFPYVSRTQCDGNPSTGPAGRSGNQRDLAFQ